VRVIALLYDVLPYTCNPATDGNLQRCVKVEARERAGNERARLCARALMLHSSLRNSLAGRNGHVVP